MVIAGTRGSTLPQNNVCEGVVHLVGCNCQFQLTGMSSSMGPAAH